MYFQIVLNYKRYVVVPNKNVRGTVLYRVTFIRRLLSKRYVLLGLVWEKREGRQKNKNMKI